MFYVWVVIAFVAGAVLRLVYEYVMTGRLVFREVHPRPECPPHKWDEGRCKHCGVAPCASHLLNPVRSLNRGERKKAMTLLLSVVNGIVVNLPVIVSSVAGVLVLLHFSPKAPWWVLAAAGVLAAGLWR